MKVRTFVGAQAAYACIKTQTTSLDIQLAPGRSAARALREWADEQQEKAARLVRQAALAQQAAEILESENGNA